MADLIVYTATRYRCPHCRKSYARERAATAHVGRCYSNPERRTCKTCRHGEGPDGQRAFGYTVECAIDELFAACCPSCGAEIWPEPGACPNGCTVQPVMRLRVLCPKWEAKTDG